jgi:hypothetical protein
VPTDNLAKWWATLDALVKRCSVGVTPLLVNDYRIPKWQGVGTGFVIVVDGHSYLVTAKHAMEEALKHKQIMVKLFGRSMLLSGMYFAPADECDISISLLPLDWLNSHGVELIYAPSLVQLPSTYESTGTYVVVGFPASRNSIDPRWDFDKTTTCLWLALNADEDETPRQGFCRPLTLDYEARVRGKSEPPSLKGMSGCPVLEVLHRRLDDSQTGISLYPRGVLCEWHKREKVIIAERIESVADLIREKQAFWQLTCDSHALPFPSVLTR